MRPLAGLPLIGWTIRSAHACPLLDRVLVSTDDAAIADIARACGGEAPFLRPPELASDEASIVAVLQHATRWVEAHERQRPAVVMLLQPTSPLRSVAEIAGVLRLIEDQHADSAQTVMLDRWHPFHRFYREGESQLVPWQETMYSLSTLRQAHRAVYRPTGSVYAARYKTLMHDNTLKGENHHGFIADEETSLDIDTAWDFRLAELILREKGLKGW